MIKQSDCTIIIPHLQGIPEANYALVQCVISLQETAKSPIIIATNGGDPLPLPAASTGIACSFKGVKRIHIWDQGQELAVNAAVATTNTPWIFVTNNDMVYAPGWFEKLTDVFKGEWFIGGKIENILCISPQLVEPRPGAPTFETYFCGGAGGDFDKEKFIKYEKDRFSPMEIRIGFNLPSLIKRELWDLIGGYDIEYRPFGSNGDSDLQAKIHLAGIQTYQNTNCIVYHFAETSGTSHPSNRHYWQKNWDYFISKWGFERQPSSDKVWCSQEIINKDKLIFHPKWEGYYGAIKY